MAASIPDSEPDGFTQGETVKWYKSVSDFSAADGWALVYEFSGGDSVTPVTGVADGDRWLITLSSAVTQAIRDGALFYQAFVSLAGERYKVADNRFNVEIDLAKTDDFDGRTIAEKILNAIDAQLKGKATQDQKKYKIGDMEIERFTPQDLITQRDYWRKQVVRDQHRQRIRDGKGTSRTVKARFI